MKGVGRGSGRGHNGEESDVYMQLLLVEVFGETSKIKAW